MIGKQLKVLLISTAIVIIATLGLLLLQRDNNNAVNEESKTIVNRDFFDVVEINVSNTKDKINVIQENGGFRMEDVSSEIINLEYLRQIVTDSAYVEYVQEINGAINRFEFGLENPTSEVEIIYKDGEILKLLIGNEGPINNTRYVQDKDTEKVYLFQKATTIRFLMSKEEFVGFVIVPPHEVQNVLSTISYVHYSGKKLERPITIKIVDENSEEELLQASSFGVASHLMLEPVVQKVDLREADKQFSALVGLLNKGIIGYDVSDSVLEEYGFYDPDLVIEFDFSPDGEREVTSYLLEITVINSQSYAMVNRNRVIHSIEDEAFLKIAYENIISRWFFTPLLLDVDELIIRAGNTEHIFTITKSGDNKIQVLKDNVEIDADAFRKFYNLVVSASHDGVYNPFSVSEPSLLEVEFKYNNENKENDRVKYYEGSARRNKVCFNETCEFAIKNTYVNYIVNALSLIENDEEFPVDWE